VRTMDDLAAFQQRILENQKKLDEIEAKRKAIKEGAQKRKLEEEKERIKREEEEKIKRARKASSLSKPKSTIHTKDRISSVLAVQQQGVSK